MTGECNLPVTFRGVLNYKELAARSVLRTPDNNAAVYKVISQETSTVYIALGQARATHGRLFTVLNEQAASLQRFPLMIIKPCRESAIYHLNVTPDLHHQHIL
ncbi:hypothetical protein GDO78_019516 [Eleutherodactylus coqui]|uniref:Uncharacterized protein n=1 Tax=Eleutherodactylus coqui TaxID=57060 RepID=A0A8J6EP10_ELECQ|nr:hypothetical protein GDO78_019516 [Eleutherodactylus coqui]